MYNPIPPEPRVPERDEVQMDMLGHNAFVVTMIGSVAFLVACLSVIF